MPAEVVTNPPVSVDSEAKTARKKRAKAEASANASNADSKADRPAESSEAKAEGGDLVAESSYVKEIQKYEIFAPKFSPETTVS